jgi:hypothetical protein
VRSFDCVVWLQFHRSHVSSPRLVKQSMQISLALLSCRLYREGYETYRAGSAFGVKLGRRTR